MEHQNQTFLFVKKFNARLVSWETLWNQYPKSRRMGGLSMSQFESQFPELFHFFLTGLVAMQAHHWSDLLKSKIDDE
jgi:hypothetical protein